MPGLTRRLLLAVLATLAPAVAASPAGAAGHTARPVRAGRERRHRRHLHDARLRGQHRRGHRDDPHPLGRGPDEQPRDRRRDEVQGRRRHDPPPVHGHRRRLLGLARHRRAAAGERRRACERSSAAAPFPLHVGMPVVARGNAQGRGGLPKVARGQIIGLHQQIVAKDESGDSETLNNVIATDAPVVPGYSGGPLENGQNRVLGIVTAGSTSGAHRGFAIPLEAGAPARAPDRERQAERRRPRRADGLPRCRAQERLRRRQDRFQVVPGKPAETAGLVKGDVITSLDGAKISSVADVRTGGPLARARQGRPDRLDGHERHRPRPAPSRRSAARRSSVLLDELDAAPQARVGLPCASPGCLHCRPPVVDAKAEARFAAAAGRAPREASRSRFPSRDWTSFAGWRRTAPSSSTARRATTCTSCRPSGGRATRPPGAISRPSMPRPIRSGRSTSPVFAVTAAGQGTRNASLGRAGGPLYPRRYFFLTTAARPLRTGSDPARFISCRRGLRRGRAARGARSTQRTSCPASRSSPSGPDRRDARRTSPSATASATTATASRAGSRSYAPSSCSARTSARGEAARRSSNSASVRLTIAWHATSGHSQMNSHVSAAGRQLPAADRVVHVPEHAVRVHRDPFQCATSPDVECAIIDTRY